MKEYRHMMTQIALTDEEKADMMEKLTQKRALNHRGAPRGRLVLAAVLAAACVLCMAAALPQLAYRFLGSGCVSGYPADDGGHITLTLPDQEDVPIVLEDGRLWFVGDGSRTDVTGLIDGETPYIYEHTDPVSGITGYVIVGGTVEDFGWAMYTDLGGAAIMGDNFGWDRGGETVYSPWFLAAAERLGFVP